MFFRVVWMVVESWGIWQMMWDDVFFLEWSCRGAWAMIPINSVVLFCPLHLTITVSDRRSYRFKKLLTPLAWLTSHIVRPMQQINIYFRKATRSMVVITIDIKTFNIFRLVWYQKAKRSMVCHYPYAKTYCVCHDFDSKKQKWQWFSIIDIKTPIVCFNDFDNTTDNGQMPFTIDIQQPMVFNDFDCKKQNGQYLFTIDIQKPHVCYWLW